MCEYVYIYMCVCIQTSDCDTNILTSFIDLFIVRFSRILFTNRHDRYLANVFAMPGEYSTLTILLVIQAGPENRWGSSETDKCE